MPLRNRRAYNDAAVAIARFIGAFNAVIHESQAIIVFHAGQRPQVDS